MVYFAVPFLWSTLAFLITPLAENASWFNLSAALTPLVTPDQAITATNWLQMATATSLWALLPLAIGVIRIAKAEIK